MIKLIIFALLVISSRSFADVGSDYFNNGDFFDAFHFYNERKAESEEDEKKNYALSSFFVRRFDISAKILETIEKKARIDEDLEPLLIESLMRTGFKDKALEEAKSLASEPLEKRLKSAIPFAFFGLKTSLIDDIQTKKLSSQSLNDYVRFLIYSFDYEKAREQIKSKEYFFNSNPEALLTKALLLLRESKPNEAMAIAEKAAALGPINSQILTFIEENEGRPSVLLEKARLLKEIMGVKPNLTLSMSYLRTLVNIILLQKESRDKLDQMIVDATSVINEIEPKMQDIPEFLVLKGIVLWQSGKQDAAVDALQKALAIDKSYGFAYQTLGAIYRLDNQLQNALLVLDEGAFYNNQDLSYYRQLSNVYMGLLNYKEALKNLDHALEIAPTNATILDMKKDVQKKLEN